METIEGLAEDLYRSRHQRMWPATVALCPTMQLNAFHPHDDLYVYVQISCHF